MDATDRNAGVTADTLFVALTRPSMRWGAAYEALLVNLVVTMQIFIFSGNPLTLLVALPIHATCVLLCSRDPRIFGLLALHARTTLLGIFTTRRVWRANSYSPLSIDLPDARGRRRAIPEVRPAHRARGEQL
jgi:type IV secretion system protein VirB3